MSNSISFPSIIYKSFNEWIDDGNVVEFTDSKGKYYSTQDSMYKNKIRSKNDLLNYFINNFKS